MIACTKFVGVLPSGVMRARHLHAQTVIRRLRLLGLLSPMGKTLLHSLLPSIHILYQASSYATGKTLGMAKTSSLNSIYTGRLNRCRFMNSA
jgi:hypothetical protein